MRKIIIIAICVIALTGTAVFASSIMQSGKTKADTIPSKDVQPTENKKADSDDLITVSVNVLSRVKLSVAYTNSTAHEISYGKAYTLQRLSKGKWKDVPLKVAFNDIGLAVGAGETVNEDIDIENNHGKLNTGHYRIVKVMWEADHYYFTKMDVIGEFDIQTGINDTLLNLSENEAIERAIKNHSEFPDKAEQTIIKEKVGGKAPGSTIPVIYETTVEKKSENLYIVMLTKTWNIKYNSVKNPTAYWTYEVSPDEIKLLNKDTVYEQLVIK